jgi:hypothetical protein
MLQKAPAAGLLTRHVVKLSLAEVLRQPQLGRARTAPKCQDAANEHRRTTELREG